MCIRKSRLRDILPAASNPRTSFALVSRELHVSISEPSLLHSTGSVCRAPLGVGNGILTVVLLLQGSGGRVSDLEFAEACDSIMQKPGLFGQEWKIRPKILRN